VLVFCVECVGPLVRGRVVKLGSLDRSPRLLSSFPGRDPDISCFLLHISMAAVVMPDENAQKRKREGDLPSRSVNSHVSSEKTTDNKDGTKDGSKDGSKDGNKSIYRGVQYDKKNNRWRARLHTDKTRHVGYYESEEEAARAWDQAALRYSCDSETVQRLNFVEESFSKFKEFVEETGDLDRFLPDMRGVGKKVTNTDPPAIVYTAQITANRLLRSIGEYRSARDAARAYDWKSIELFGWGVLTNFPLYDYEQQTLSRGGLSGLDNSEMPDFPDIRRFAETKKLARSAGGAQATSGLPPTVTAQSNGAPLATAVGLNPDNTTAAEANLQLNMDQIAGKSVDSSILLAMLVQQQQQQQQQLQEHFQQELKSLQQQLHDHQKTQEGAQQGIQQGVEQEKVDEQGLKIDSAGLIIPSQGQGDFEAVARVSLGKYETESSGKDALDRAEPMIKGLSRLSAEDYRQHIELMQRSQAKLQDRIQEKNGLFYAKLKILSKSFEVGPYPTAGDARLAHDKYCVVLYGASAQLFSPLASLLLAKDELESLLNAVEKIKSGAAPTTDEISPPAFAKPAPLSVDELPASSLLANAYTSTLRKVASQTSFHDEGADLYKQLDKIESTVEANLPKVSSSNRIMDKATGIAMTASGSLPVDLDSTSPHVQREPNVTPFPLPTFPVAVGAQSNNAAVAAPVEPATAQDHNCS
jgi:hypothetical protein